MKDNSVFESTSYKQIMKSHLRGANKRGSLSRAAEAMNCQRSYLSRVMNSKMQLTMDQVFVLCRHLKFSNEESEYFQTLVELERASDRSYREFLQHKIKELKRKHESISEIIDRPRAMVQSEATYFSSWYWSAIHFLTSVPGLQTPQKLAEKLGLPLAVVQVCLDQLQDWGFVHFQNGIWEYVGGEFHLPNSSPFVSLHHQNWRTRAILDSQNPQSEGLHYTNIQTASHQDIERLKKLALEFIRECNSLLAPSKPEEGLLISLDLFKL